jgi:hypothetical protein
MSPLELILQDIGKAIDAKLPYLAIAVSLSIPDICAAMECEPGKIWVNKVKYEAWCDANLIPKFTHITAQDCYRMRCGVIHQGNFGRSDDRYDRIAFTVPGMGVSMMETIFKDNGGVKETILSLDAKTFCQIMNDCAKAWEISKKSDANVTINMNNLIRFRPEGFPPQLVDVHLIG